MIPFKDDEVLDPTEDIEEVEPEETPLPNYALIPRTTEIIESYPAKKKDRVYGLLTYPKGSKVIITTKDFRFWSESSIMEFLGTLTATKPREIVEQVKEKFERAPIGIAQGVEGRKVNVIWVEPNSRIYFDPETGEKINFMPKCIKT